MHSKKIGFVLALSALAVSCNQQKLKRIAVIPKGTSAIFWQTVHAGAMAAGEENKVEILWDGPPAETEYARQLAIFDSMLNRHVDGIVVAPTEKRVLNATFDRAVREKIPVVMFDSGADTDAYVSFVATDNYEAGKTGGRTLAKLLNGKGEVGLIGNVPGSASTVERERGFTDVIAAEFPAIKIVATQFGMSDRAKSLAATENILTAHPTLSGLFASCEPSSLGAAQALKSRNLAGKVKFVAFDASDPIVEAMREGTIDALVAQDPFRMGHDAVQVLVDSLNGKTPAKKTDLPATVITKADLDKPEVKQLLNPDLKKYLK